MKATDRDPLECIGLGKASGSELTKYDVVVGDRNEEVATAAEEVVALYRVGGLNAELSAAIDMMRSTLRRTHR